MLDANSPLQIHGSKFSLQPNLDYNIEMSKNERIALGTKLSISREFEPQIGRRKSSLNLIISSRTNYPDRRFAARYLLYQMVLRKRSIEDGKRDTRGDETMREVGDSLARSPV